MTTIAARSEADQRGGVAFGLLAFSLWGVFPVYFKWLETVPATEVLLHRIIWAVPFGALIIHLRRQWSDVRRALTHTVMLAWLAAAALCIALNWYIYIHAVQTEQIFQASLGYYINPLLYVLVGACSWPLSSWPRLAFSY